MTKKLLSTERNVRSPIMYLKQVAWGLYKSWEFVTSKIVIRSRNTSQVVKVWTSCKMIIVRKERLKNDQ